RPSTALRQQPGVLLQQPQGAGTDRAEPRDADLQRLAAHEARLRTASAGSTRRRKDLTLRTAWRTRCSFSTRPKRTKPSPYSPKPIPGATATSASVSSSLEKASEPSGARSGGSGAQANIVAGGLGTCQPAAASPSISTS